MIILNENIRYKSKLKNHEAFAGRSTKQDFIQFLIESIT